MTPLHLPVLFPMLFDIIETRRTDYSTPTEETRRDFWERFSKLLPQEQEAVRETLDRLSFSSEWVRDVRDRLSLGSATRPRDRDGGL